MTDQLLPRRVAWSSVTPTSPSGCADRSQTRPIMRLQTCRSASAVGRRSATSPSTSPMHQVTALIGPSGSGKTTLLRALNRMHDLTRAAKVTGTVTLGNVDIYGGGDASDAPALACRDGLPAPEPVSRR